MRIARVLVLLMVTMGASACLDLEVKVHLFQDGTGFYEETMEVPKNLIDLAMAQQGFGSYEEMVADAVRNAQKQLEAFPGVRLIDASGDWEGTESLRISVRYEFDAVDRWNAYAAQSEKPAIEFEQLDAPNGTATWTVVVVSSGAAIPDAEQLNSQAPAEGGGFDMGSFRVVVAGPGTPVPPGEPNDAGYQTALGTDGAVIFTGSLQALAKTQRFLARYTGKPLTAEALAAAKAAAQPAPSKSFAKIQEAIARQAERAAVAEAAQRAITDSRFVLHLTVLADERVSVANIREYYGAAAALMAGREAMMDALIPELAGNYRTTVSAVSSPDGRGGIAIARHRDKPVDLERLAAWLGKERDGQDWVYTLRLAPLLETAPDATDAAMGKVVLVVPGEVTGTNGTKTGANEVTLELDANRLTEANLLVVRVAVQK